MGSSPSRGCHRQGRTRRWPRPRPERTAQSHEQPSGNVPKLFSSLLTTRPSKLECLLPGDCTIRLFYDCNCCCIIISQSVCHSHSLPPQSNIDIGRQDQEPNIRLEPYMKLHSGRLQPYLQISYQGGSKDSSFLRYGNNYSRKKFIVLAPVRL